jgi:peptide deformylase
VFFSVPPPEHQLGIQYRLNDLFHITFRTSQTMPILELQLNDAPILRQKAAPIKHIDAKLIQLIRDMFETMHDAEGIGLAAPQVGISQRVIVVDIEEQFPQIPPLALINPVITKAEGEELAEEGCLSLPEQTGMVRRAMDITVKGVLPNGKAVAFEANSLLARVLQHEIDHLDGILFIDRLIPEDQVLLEERGEEDSP